MKIGWMALMAGLLFGGASATRAQENAPAIYLVGDSTMCNYGGGHLPMQGWGYALRSLANEGVSVKNHAERGRSTKRFRDEKRWEKILNEIKPGDFVVIQFGHNDQNKKNKVVYADPEKAYPDYLRLYIDEARAKGAHPVLATPINRRQFDEAGILKDTLGEYAEAMRRVARAKEVALVDLEAATRELWQKDGPEASKRYFNHLPEGTHGNYPKGVADDTHLNGTGAETVAKLFVDAAKKQKLPIGELFK